MLILLITNLYPSPAHPAFGPFVGARVAALRALGVDIRLVANRNADVHRGIALKYARLAVGAGREAVSGRLLRRESIDVVEAHIAYPTGLVARPIAALVHAPLVLFAHGADVTDVPWRSQRHERLARSTLGAATAIVANSRFLAGQIERRFPDIRTPVHVVSPGILYDTFAKHASPDREGVLYVGRLLTSKGPDVLIRAVARARGTGKQLTLLGEGPERENLARLARSMAVDTEMPGEVVPAQVAEAMGRAAVVVVPSTYQEPLGLVALEAMAAGAIVIASAVGGLTETVRDGENGLLVPPDDVEALAKAIEVALELAGDPVRSGKLREAARQTAAAHDIVATTAETVRLYGTLRS